jgi:hypothetical protein
MYPADHDQQLTPRTLSERLVYTSMQLYYESLMFRISRLPKALCLGTIEVILLKHLKIIMRHQTIPSADRRANRGRQTC